MRSLLSTCVTRSHRARRSIDLAALAVPDLLPPRRPYARTATPLPIREPPARVATKVAERDEHDGDGDGNTVPSLDPRPRESPRVPTGEASMNPAAWLSTVEHYLPTRLQSSQPRWPLPSSFANVNIVNLPDVVLEARRTAGINLLTELAHVQRRWDAMLWVADVILQLCKEEETPPTLEEMLRPQKVWPRVSALDELSTGPIFLPFSKDVGRNGSNNGPSWLLEDYASDPFSTMHVSTWPETLRHIGILWEAATDLLLAGISSSSRESAISSRYALRILCQMHHRGYIPAQVYQESPSEDPFCIRQPALISEIGDSIMSALIDAAIEDSGPFGRRTPLVQLDIRPELWMEFILWCCVRGGWLVEAASILRKLQNLPGRSAWHLVSWQELENNPVSAQARLGVRRAASQGSAAEQQAPQKVVLAKNPSETDLSQTISLEVVVALLDAMVAAQGTLPLEDQGTSQVCDMIGHVRYFVEQEEQATLNTLSWPEVVSRLADHDAGSPRNLEHILDAIATPQPLMDDREGSRAGPLLIGDITSKQDTAAALGHYQQLVSSSCARKDTLGMLRHLKSLLDFSDQCKGRAVRSFAQRLGSGRAGRIDRASIAGDAVLTTSGLPYFRDILAPQTLANVLTLLVDQRYMDVAEWMLSSANADGPLIPSAMYGDSAVKPALLNLAIANADDKLLSTVLEAGPRTLNGKGLLTMFRAMALRGQWQRASKVLRVLENRDALKISVMDFARAAGSLIHHSPPSSNDDSTVSPTRMLADLLSNEAGPIWGFDPSCAHNIGAVLVSANRELAAPLSPILSRMESTEMLLDVHVFNALLGDCIEADGSEVGVKLYETWCSSSSALDLTHIELHSSVRETPRARSRVAEMFSVPESDSSASDPPRVTVTGKIRPNTVTMRLIMQQAQDEIDGEGSSLKTQKKAWEVLRWVQDKQGRSWPKTEQETEEQTSIDAFSLSEQPVLPYGKEYSAVTLNIWAQMHDDQIEWLRSVEASLKKFMESGEVQATFGGLSRRQRKYVHSLASDFDLSSVTEGEHGKRKVVVNQRRQAKVPQSTVEEAFQQTQEAG